MSDMMLSFNENEFGKKSETSADKPSTEFY